MRILIFFMVLLIVAAGCTCTSNPSATDADIDTHAGDTDNDDDVEGDAVTETDADVEQDADQESDSGEYPMPCDDSGPAWSWKPSECAERYEIPGCYASCQPLTCRNLAVFPDIWENLVSYEAEASVYVVDLTNGREEVAFQGRFIDHGTNSYSYSHASISSRYVVARRLTNNPFGTQIVAKPVDNLSVPEIVLDEETLQGNSGSVDVHEQWVVWTRERASNSVYELVLHNIETDENRVLDSSDRGCSPFQGRVWGDRVLWANGCGEIKAQNLETEETQTVYSNSAHYGMASFGVWENYAVFSNDTRDDYFVLYLVNLETGESNRISPYTNQRTPSIHDGRVAWSDESHGLWVMVYSIESGQTYSLHPSRGGSNTVIYGQTLTWANKPIETEPLLHLITRIGDI